MSHKLFKREQNHRNYVYQKTLYILSILVPHISLQLQGSCTDQFEDWSKGSEFCYQMIEEGKDWYNAKDACSSLGGELAVVHDESLMMAVIEQTHGVDAWIGLKKDELADGT